MDTSVLSFIKPFMCSWACVAAYRNEKKKAKHIFRQKLVLVIVIFIGVVFALGYQKPVVYKSLARQKMIKTIVYGVNFYFYFVMGTHDFNYLFSIKFLVLN